MLRRNPAFCALFVTWLCLLSAASPAAADDFVPVDLSPLYNVRGVASGPGAAKFGGMEMGVPAEVFPAGDPAVIYGIPFRLGAPGGPDIVAPQGQVVPFPPGKYRWLFLLGVSARDNAGGTLALDYAEGADTFPLQFTSWMYSPQIGEVVAGASPHYWGPAGKVASPVNVFLQLVPLDGAKTLRAIVLPDQPNIQIFGLTLAAGDPLARQVHFGRVPVPAWQFCESSLDYRTGPRESAVWKTVRPGHAWVGSSPYAWLKATVRVPAEFAGLPVICRAIVRNGGIFINYYGGDVYVDGRRFQHFSGNLAEVKLCDAAKADESHEVVIQFFTPEGQGTFIDAYLIPQPIDELSMLLRSLPPALAFAGRPLAEGDAVGRSLWPKVEEGFRAGGWRAASDALRAACAAHAGADDALNDREYHLFPNSHVDMEWLWTLEETETVLKNTFSGVCDFMDRYPFTFAQSQGSAYEMIEKADPATFERVRKAVAAGQWALVGGMWCEPDLNLPSGEALCRHFLVTQDYFQKKFGRRAKVGWNPDSFGHSANVPQILRKSGIAHYVHFRPPAAENDGAYRWEGLDGSAVTAFRGPVWYIRVNVTPEEVLRDLQEFANRYGTKVAATCYGVGDHGGIPPFSDAERTIAMDALPVFPRVRFSTPEAFFEKFDAQVTKPLKTIRGERNYTLRGCYVSHSNTKFSNRRGEWGLVAAEAAATAAGFVDPSYPYPGDGFTGAWKGLLFNQFHDILPGSAVADAFGRTIKNRYREVRQFEEQARNEALARIAANVGVPAAPGSGPPPSPTGFGGPGELPPTAVPPTAYALVFNPLSWAYSGPVKVGESTLLVQDVPPVGYRVVAAGDGEGKGERGKGKGETGVRVEGLALENGFLRVEVDGRTGAVTRVFDKANAREVLTGPANVLEFREDVGNAWEIMYGYDVGEFGNIDTRGPGKRLAGDVVRSVRVVETGPVRAAIEAVSDFRGSTLIRRVVLYAGSPMAHFEFARDWKTDCANVIVKAMFPLDVPGAVARSEVPYGSVERPADGAEVPAQTWLNLDRPDGAYGVALLNDGRYGHSVKDATIGLSLLRDPPVGPDPRPEDAGEGNHVATYALYPHAGDWRKAQVLRRAWELNAPPLTRVIAGPQAGTWPAQAGFASVEPGNVVLGAFKRAQNGDGVVLRLVETAGQATKARVRTAFPGRPHQADILEDAGGAIPAEGGSFEIELAPWGIETVLVK